MQYLTYDNLDLRLTFNSILSLFTKFWITSVINKKSFTKICLTIIVYNSNNKSYTLINNLFFDINGYTDILIVIKEILYTNRFNHRFILNRIVFKYYLEPKDNYNIDLHNINKYLYLFIVLTLLLSFWLLIIFIWIYSIYNFEYLDIETLKFTAENITDFYFEEINDNSTTKPFIFSPFIDLFTSNNVPSKFIDKNLYELSILKPLCYNEEILLEVDKNSVTYIILKLNDRIADYETLVADLMELKSNPSLEN